MNWTGGSLQRHSRKTAKNTVNRQRQHFAKARTALQNDTKPQLTPFRPSYIPEEDDALSNQLPSFGLKPIGHTGHSRNHQEQREGSGSPPRWNHGHANAEGARGSAVVAAHRPGPLSLYKSASLISRAPDRPTYAERAKSRTSEADIETQLLEANRQRLLLQQDWLGLAPPRPVTIAFASTKEKDRIGKRRKLDRQENLQHKAEAVSARPTAVHSGEYRHPRAFTSAAVRDGLEDIRVQIGMDALASETPMQQFDHAHSQTPEISHGNSPGPMLFDHEELYSAPILPARAPRSVSEDRVESLGTFEETHRHSQQPSAQTTRQRLPGPWSYQRGAQRRQEVLSSTQLRRPGATQLGQNLYDSVQTHVPPNARGQNEEIGPGVLIKQHGGGVGERSIRLILEQTSDILGDRDDAVVVTDMQCTAAHDSPTRMRANASSRESGHADGEADNERTSARKVSSHAPIDDDCSWRAFVDVRAGSSTSTTTSRACLSRTPKEPVKNGSTTSGPTNWSQHVAQSGQTGVDVLSSSLSASLPPVRQTDGPDILQAGLQAGLQAPIQEGNTVARRQSHAAGRSDELWKTFVFECDDNLASETSHEKVDNVEVGPTHTSSRRNWSGLLPSCAVVASSDNSKGFPHTF